MDSDIKEFIIYAREILSLNNYNTRHQVISPTRLELRVMEIQKRKIYLEISTFYKWSEQHGE